jgi:hypothetical protein
MIALRTRVTLEDHQRRWFRALASMAQASHDVFDIDYGVIDHHPRQITSPARIVLMVVPRACGLVPRRGGTAELRSGR